MRKLMLLVLLAFAVGGCGGDDDDVADAARIDAHVGLGDGALDGGADNADANCFATPTTHYQIINACTTAQKIDRRPVLPLLNANGTLPGLP